MIAVKDLRADLLKLGKHLSLRQIAIQSKINYLTLRNIKIGKSKRVTEGIAKRFYAFKEGFNPATAKKVLRKRGRKSAAPKDAAKPAMKSAAPKPAAKATAKPAPKPAAKPAAKAPARKRRAARRGRPARPAPAVAAGPLPGSILQGSTLDRELAMTEARLEYLRQLKRAEQNYLSAVSGK